MLEFGAATRPKRGATVSGDRYFVHTGNGSALLAVIDGLGGGTAAAQAADRALAAIEAHHERPLEQIMQAAHQACLGTRGAVIGLLRLDLQQHSGCFVGVGNIGIQIVSQEAVRPISRNGIVGYRLPTLLAQPISYQPGDLFILFSDGISNRVALHPGQHLLPAQALAEAIMAEFGKDSDDVTVVVARHPASQTEL